ncbi:PREDICTED: pickpocket protein 11-like [Rhagoletis zephyria]|uniref:pickpocket protein 11-like n=1 Tax=Rhagoletis zephyria TaxID=28612 RepID=UPI000811A9FC|nr:PREDICTED: pickpocket protein 11-like [Rhagoletis zephyria]
MFSTKSKSVPSPNKTDPLCYIIFDEYLKPKKSKFGEKSNGLLPLKSLCAKEISFKQRISERWRLLAKKTTTKRIVKVKPVNGVDASARDTHRNAVVLKTNFDMYCEIASLHGFRNLLGATKWHRIFWYSILCILFAHSNILLYSLCNLYADNPTVLYLETTTGTIFSSSFPSVTLCNLNRISKKKVNELLKRDFSPQAAEQIRSHLDATLYSILPVNTTSVDFSLLKIILDSKNYTHTDFLEKITPDCRSQLLRCKLHGQVRLCSDLFQRVETQHGFCCLFDYRANVDTNQPSEIYTNRFGYKWGLSVLIDPQEEDYYASRHKLAGYQIFARKPTEFITMNTQYEMAFRREEIYVHVTPLETLYKSYVRRELVEKRRCYLPGEYKLTIFANYTHTNCLTECRTRLMLETCGCVPPLWPRAENWTVCTFIEANCVTANYDIFTRTLLNGRRDYKTNAQAEKYICDCYPECRFHLYKMNYDVTRLDRNYSVNNRKFFQDIELKDHLVVHVFYADMFDFIMRLDVYNTWLTYFGMIGGITSIHLGYSFISGFEIIFFIFVRPIRYWLTRNEEVKNVLNENISK